MIQISKVILFATSGKILQVTFPKVPLYGIMATQLLATLTTVHHLCKCGIVVYLVNPRHLFHSIPLDVCLVSQLQRCCYVSFSKLIVSCSIFEKIDSIEFSFLLIVVLDEVVKASHRDQDDAMNQHPRGGQQDRKDCVSLCPLCLLTSRPESRDEILLQWG